MTKLLQCLKDCFPKRLLGIYLIIGIWNTVFGTGAYFGCVRLFNSVGRFGYMIGAVLSSIIGVTQSFLSYKWFAFKTKGNYLSEYIKCWTVYGTATLINTALLPVIVEITRCVLSQEYKTYAPYIGGVLLTGVTVLISFVGHSKFTFKHADSAIEEKRND